MSAFLTGFADELIKIGGDPVKPLRQGATEEWSPPPRPKPAAAANPLTRNLAGVKQNFQNRSMATKPIAVHQNVRPQTGVRIMNTPTPEATAPKVPKAPRAKAPTVDPGIAWSPASKQREIYRREKGIHPSSPADPYDKYTSKNVAAAAQAKIDKARIARNNERLALGGYSHYQDFKTTGNQQP